MSHNIFHQKKINKVLIACPFWRCGSTLMAQSVADHYGLQNHDEILYDPDADPTYDKKNNPNTGKGIDVDTIKDFLNAEMRSSSGRVHHHITQHISDDYEGFDWKQYLKDPSSKWVIKVHADQFRYLSNIIEDQDLHQLFAQPDFALIFLHREGVVPALLSSLDAMLTGISHEARDELHPRFQYVTKAKKHYIDHQPKNIEKVAEGLLQLYEDLMVPSINQCNEWIRAHHTHFYKTHQITYEAFQNVPQLSSRLRPYHKSEHYQAVFEEVDNLLHIPKELLYSHQRFILR